MSVPAGTDCLLTLQPGHYAKVPFSPTRGSHAQALSIRPQLDFFGDLKSSKTAASKSLKEKRQAKKAKAAGSGSSPTGTSITKWPAESADRRETVYRSGILRCPDDAGGPTLGCDEGLMSIGPPDPVADAHITMDDFQNLALTRRGADLR